MLCVELQCYCTVYINVLWIVLLDLAQVAIDDEGYETPELNDHLYLHFKASMNSVAVHVFASSRLRVFASSCLRVFASPLGRPDSVVTGCFDPDDL